MYAEDWGEQMGDIRRPVVIVVDVASGDVEVVDQIPSHISAGQVSILIGATIGAE